MLLVCGEEVTSSREGSLVPVTVLLHAGLYELVMKHLLMYTWTDCSLKDFCVIAT